MGAWRGCCSACLREAPWCKRRDLEGGGQPSQAMLSRLLPLTSEQPCSCVSCISPAKCSGLPWLTQVTPKCGGSGQQRELGERKRSRRSLAGAAPGEERGGSHCYPRGLCCTQVRQLLNNTEGCEGKGPERGRSG